MIETESLILDKFQFEHHPRFFRRTQYIMGRDIRVTLNTYTHLGFEDAEKELERVSNL